LLLLIVLVLGLLTTLMAVPVLAQTGGGYDLTWNTIDGGGGVSSGGGYTLSGAIGQPDAGLAVGGGYALVSGFWAAAGGSSLFMPIVQR
jgi:hypothetical protein